MGRYELSRDAILEISNFQSLSPGREVTSVGGLNVGNVMTVYGDMLYSGNPQRPEVQREKLLLGADFKKTLEKFCILYIC